MAKNSTAFDKMRKALFDTMVEIPAGQVTEFSGMGAALNAPARHIAFIVSKMTGDEREVLPWYRLVPRNGKFGGPQKWSAIRTMQVDLLRKEGVTVDQTGTVMQFQDKLHVPDDKHANTFWADLEDD